MSKKLLALGCVSSLLLVACTAPVAPTPEDTDAPADEAMVKDDEAMEPVKADDDAAVDAMVKDEVKVTETGAEVDADAEVKADDAMMQ